MDLHLDANFDQLRASWTHQCLNSSWDYRMDSMTDLTMEVSMDKMKEDLSE